MVRLLLSKEERKIVDSFTRKKMKRDEIIRERYKEIATVYDKSRFESIQGMTIDKKQKDALFRSLKGLQKDSKILEAGCGTGRFLEFLENKGYKNLHGIDQAEEMLKIASKKSHAMLERGDIYHLPFKKNSFDAVYSVRVLFHLEKPEKAINEMLRVGKIVIFDIVNKDSLSYIASNLYKKMCGKKPSGLSTKSFKIGDIENGFKNKFEIIPVHYAPINVSLPQIYFRHFDFLESILGKIHPKKFAPQVFVKIIKIED